ncbi:MAG: bifunctional metallophosphatase/5'-nucleotidase [Oscillatoriales cyanobacterium RM2_1_1]|nr:bifunctional metallophosphatase/5'-nucleotidase [Oscillatoriales cyanobacterium SM2_3_0]NJO45530.1 bifunctional metallophosphatase/5'-nucleotidase [Oscillatoriales cyanobacterium RM2_1_1]
MIRRNFFLALFCVITVLGISTVSPAQSPLTKTITILETSDLHGNLMPWDYFANQSAEWGLAKIATLIEQERLRNPNTLVIDNGDTIQGTPLAYFYNKIDIQSPHPVAAALNQLQFDVFVPGNHDFDFGLEVLSRWTEQLQATVLCANLVRPDGTPAFKPYILREIDGVTVGILGLTTTGVTNWLPAENFGGLSFIDPIATAQRYVPELRQQGADVIVVAQHTGWEKAPGKRSNASAWLESPNTWESTPSPPGENVTIALAEQVKGIDIILAGHSHLDVPQSVINQVLIAEPSYWGKALSKFTVQLEKRSGGWKIIQKDAVNLPVNGISPNSEFVQRFQSAHEQTLEYINQPIGVAKAAFVGGAAARYHSSALANLINSVQIQAAEGAGYPVDIGITAIFTDTGAIPAGNITLRNAYSVYVYDNRLFVIEINGDMLRRSLEKNAAYFKQLTIPLPDSPKAVVAEQQRSYNWDLYRGIDYALDLTQPLGKRVTRLEFQGKPVEPDQTFRVALNNYRALGGGGYTMFKEGKIIWQSTQEIRELIAKYLTYQEIVDPQDYVSSNFQLVPDLYAYYFGNKNSQ